MKCVALIACEKVIIDKDGAHSLINIMNHAMISAQTTPEPGQSPQKAEIDPHALMPITWWIYTQWSPSSEHVGKTFQQVYQVFWPNGDKLIESAITFTQLNDKMQQTTFFVMGFPVGQEGRVKLVAWLNFEGQRMSEICESHIDVNHVAQIAGRATMEITGPSIKQVMPE